MTAGRTATIFLVQANALVARDTALQLTKSGYLVEVFASLTALVESSSRLAPVAVVLDLGKGAATPDLAPVINAVRARLNCAVLVLSTRGNFESRLGAVRAGADAYFIRPFDLAQLSEKIQSLSPATERRPYRLLHVADTNTYASSSALQSEEFEVASLAKSADLFNMLSRYRAELVLIDIALPDCSGIDLVRLIRQDQRYVDLAIVCRGSDQLQQALAAGADDFVAQNLGAEQLRLTLACRAERYRALRSLILRDSLTGLYNHAAIKEYLVREMALVERHAAPLSMAIIDLDHFKKVNDTYGHPAGDRVITALARLLQKNLRRGDIIGRYGGEEFVVVMPATSLEAALAVLQDIGSAFAQLRHEADGVGFVSSFSAGVAQALGHADAEALLRAADTALYRAKHAGRNRVFAADAP